jgi:hypothetical protein
MKEIMRNSGSSFFSLAVLAMLFWGPTPLEGQEKRFYLMPFVGVQSDIRFGRLVPLPNTADVPEIKVLMEHKQPALGLSLGYRLNGHLDLEGTALFARSRIVNDVGIGIGGNPLGRVGISDANFYSVSGSLLYNFRSEGFSPYLGAGAGAAILNTHRMGSSTRPQLLLRAGAKFPVTNRLGLILDVRDSVTFLRYAEDFNVAFPMIYRFDFNKNQHTLGVSLGLRYYY